ncbi:LysR substrate-binding domain-containing protein [Fulvimonas soli]|jgi:DNA-binding transcriptional LysR family regulator|uniref:LysR family transcriptional regulator n=1 Tax=Fulvimonas soli TaxID=155197 RepID=A0A316I1B0_9GAMM|nr:LysR substrate-binding domain-containing protein [Fulvimonas soli]PWK86769.1 LysR family transcriptional regulator [Fulvimonas soli]
MQDLNDIYYFVQVVELGTFTAASKALGVAKSQLSFRIARLEENLGVRLIQRTTRRSHVTDIGQLYYQQCLQILAAAQQAQNVIEEAQAAPRGRIRVGCPVLFGQLLLAPALVQYLRRYPDVHVDVDTCDHDADVVASGFDIAFRVRQSVKDSSLVVRSFGMDPQMLVASPALLKQLGRPQRPKDLKRLPSVGAVSTEGRHFWTLIGPDGRSIQVEHHPRLATDDLHLLFQAVTGGIAMAQLPAWLCHDAIGRGRLVPLLGAYTLPPGNVHAVYPSRHGHTPAVRSFIEFMAAELPRALQVLQRAPEGRYEELEAAVAGCA